LYPQGEERIALDVSNLNPGYYIVLVNTRDGKENRLKLLKSNSRKN